MTTTMTPPETVEAEAPPIDLGDSQGPVVVDHPVNDTTAQPQPDYVSIYGSSIFAVTVLFLVGVGVPLSIFLDDWMGGMGVGAMCAFWGGPSFGVMTGAARVSAWLEANHVDL